VLFGRLVRAKNPQAADTVYVVAEADPGKAADIIRNNVVGPNVEIEDLGRLSAEPLKSLGLKSGQFVRVSPRFIGGRMA
jgi:hypothetical protein